MPHPSVALKDFNASLAAAGRLAHIEARYNDPPTPRGAPAVEALRGGYCVLVVGAFERFLAESFSEHLGRLATQSPAIPFGALPNKLVESTVYESLDLAMKGPVQGGSATRSVRLPNVLRAARVIVDERVDAQALAQTKSNPDGKAVDRMFKALGISDAFRETRTAFDAIWGRPEASSFVRDTLDAIVNQRHVVAHTASALAISRADLQRWERFLAAFASAVDQRLELYVANLIAGIRPP